MYLYKWQIRVYSSFLVLLNNIALCKPTRSPLNICQGSGQYLFEIPQLKLEVVVWLIELQYLKLELLLRMKCH